MSLSYEWYPSNESHILPFDNEKVSVIDILRPKYLNSICFCFYFFPNREIGRKRYSSGFQRKVLVFLFVCFFSLLEIFP